MTTKKRVLFAGMPEGVQVISDMLEDQFNLVTCTSHAQAQTLLVAHVDLIICGIHFDDSRMFDLLRYCKSTPETKSIPFLCLRGMRGALHDTLSESVEISTRLLGAVGFVDLTRWHDEFGYQGSAKRLRALVAQLASETGNF
jgi:CheY-like chemotaxis protein